MYDTLAMIKPNASFTNDDLYRVRGVPGVAWAVRLFKNIARARFDDGNFQQVILLGLDDATMVGAPDVKHSLVIRDGVNNDDPSQVYMHEILNPSTTPPTGHRRRWRPQAAPARLTSGATGV